MYALLPFIHYAHVLAAICWVGSGVLITFALAPALTEMSDGARHEAGQAMLARLARLMPIFGGVTILLGILRAAPVVAGSWTTLYAVTAYAGLVLALALVIGGARVLGPLLDHVVAAETSGERDQLAARFARLSRLELVGFAVVIALMVAMRFGY